MTQTQSSEPPLFVGAVKMTRSQIKEAARAVNGLHENVLALGAHPANTEEIHANIQLAYRHLEDAAMRLGKAIQAFDGGKSVYDQ